MNDDIDLLGQEVAQPDANDGVIVHNAHSDHDLTLVVNAWTHNKVHSPIL